MPGDVRFVRAHDRHLSLWQSAVAKVAHTQLGATGSPTATLATADHPLANAVNDHVEATLAGAPPEEPPPGSGDVAKIRAFLSHNAFHHAMAWVEGDVERVALHAEKARQYSDHDPGFLSCVSTFAYYWTDHRGVFKYNDWTREGGGDINYGVIQWRIPNDATIGIIGDWGTGLGDAQALLQDMVTNHNPAVIIHLGDIYYSGTAEECKHNYTAVFDEVLGAHTQIPVFTLLGNHDYYALGYPVYNTFQLINNGIDGAQQDASYFCLRTEDDGWQFLGMDTGRHDSNPGDQVDPLYAGPWLEPTEIKWHQHKLDTFGGATVLLSHHQFFTAHGKLNGSLSPYRDLPYLNPFLNEVFAPYFANDVAGWLWGHEHNFVLYRNLSFGLAKGRLVGCSAYEEDTGADPYSIKNPEVQYLDPEKYRLGSEGGYFNHGYAVIDLSQRATPTSPVSISYYEYPSWGTQAPPSPASTLIYTEELARPSEAPPQPVEYAQGVALSAQEGLFVGPLDMRLGRAYPTLGPALPPFGLLLAGGSGGVRHGDRLQITTTEHAAGGSNVLGAWSTPALYYYSGGSESQTWTIQKRDPADPQVHFGDEVSFVNAGHTGQSLQPYWSRLYASVFLTTKAGAPYYWTLQPR